MNLPAVKREVRCSGCGRTALTKLPLSDPVVTEYDLHTIGWERIGGGFFCPKCRCRPRIVLRMKAVADRLFGGDLDG